MIENTSNNDTNSNAPDVTKYIAAFRSGALGENILEVYFSFFAHIILNEKWQEVSASVLLAKINENYGNLTLTIPFINQVLSVGVENGSIAKIMGKYMVVDKNMKQYETDKKDFNSQINLVIDDFCDFYGKAIDETTRQKTENMILKYIDAYDSNILLDGYDFSEIGTTDFDRVWNIYLQHIAKAKPHYFDIVSALCFSNIILQAMFYKGDEIDSFRGLNVYLDSPLVFAVLGMDITERVDSIRILVNEMQRVGCNVQILDNNYDEISGIITVAGKWATSAAYDIAKANNAGRFFHDSKYDTQKVDEYCTTLKESLLEYGITVKKTNYDTYEQEFQEDEETLYSMVEEKYKSNGYKIPSDKEHSIKIDVRSIIMIYRMRQGHVSTRVEESMHIMLTLNNAIANVCKNYESNKSINSGHIPVCVSSDLFGTILWLFSPDKMVEYRRSQLLADCYDVLKPTKKMLEKYVDSLNTAMAAGEIDEKKYLMMRSHPVVYDALMNVTKGDYARFNDKTYLEVYDEIVAIAETKYVDEVNLHEETKKELERLEQESIRQQSTISRLKAEQKMQFDKKCSRWGWVVTILIFFIPYAIIAGIIEIVKSYFSDFRFIAIVVQTVLFILTVLLTIFYTKGKESSLRKVTAFFTKREQQKKPQELQPE